MQQKRQYALRNMYEDLSKVQMDAPPMGTYPDLSGVAKYAEDNAELFLQLLEQRQLTLVLRSYFAASSTDRHFGRLKAKFSCKPVYLLTDFLYK